MLRFIATEMVGDAARNMRRGFQTRGYFQDLHALVRELCVSSAAMLRWGFAILLSLSVDDNVSEELKTEYAALMRPIVASEGALA